MITGRPPLLSERQEARLKDELVYCFSMDGASAEVVAEFLEFGKKGTVYEKLKRYHIYYSTKFGIETSIAKPENVAPWLMGTNEYFGQ